MLKFFSYSIGLFFLVPFHSYGSQGLPMIGEQPKSIVLDGDKGGLVSNGQAWNSDSIKGKLNLLVYVDPDESEANNTFTSRLKAEEFGSDILGSIAIINMEATWKPNMIIKSILESKQKEFPSTTYVMDKKKVLVQEWQLKDDAYEVILFDQAGKVLFRKDGVLSNQDIDQFIKIVKDHSQVK